MSVDNSTMPSLALESITLRILCCASKRCCSMPIWPPSTGVDTRRPNEQVRRNRARFPYDFIFELTADEFANLKSKFATSSSIASNHGGRRKLTLAFTEHGAIMAATILSSPRAVEVSVYVVRVFFKAA